MKKKTNKIIITNITVIIKCKYVNATALRKAIAHLRSDE